MLFLNSIVEGRLSRSVASEDDVAADGLSNVLRLQELAGKRIVPTTRHDGGRGSFEVLHPDGALHAVYWLSAKDQGRGV